MRIVLLHALPFDRRMWAAQLDDLSDGTLAPTMYGFGSTLQDWAAGVLRLVGDEPCVVVGCSVGGSVALEVARASPDQVLGLVLIGAKAAVRPEPEARDEAIRMLVHDGLEAGWHAMWRPLFGHNADERTVAAAATWAGEQRLDAIVAGVRAFHDRRDLRSFANDWNGPIVMISGDQDRTPAPSAARLHGRRRRFHLVDDCGHYCG